ncbi:MAG: hypothetical protein CMK32_09725 [Porticoccaceae bacterium]|mgnify:CR=1 FL=1|nr:hypothetical protein [Porticoccaceae bacterium]|tara:strand:- start:243 stop:620 length:378 start_codon:yes stop_codon:yes gene_type:complete
MQAVDIDVDDVLDAYITAALWSTTDDNDEPLDENYAASDLAPETLERMRADVVSFVEKHASEIAAWEGDDAAKQAGHDLWFTRCGHGVGFWESEWGRPGEILDSYAKSIGEVWLYVGNDEKIYIA